MGENISAKDPRARRIDPWEMEEVRAVALDEAKRQMKIE